MRWEEMIIGPQLVGMVFMLAGWLQLKRPPKKINGFYGYRTTLSMKNQRNWDEGNLYSSRLIIRLGLIMIPAGFTISGLFQFIHDRQVRMALNIPLLIIGSMVCVVILLTKTDRHLEKFEKENP